MAKAYSTKPFNQLSREEVLDLAAKYKYPKDASFILAEVRPKLEQRGYLTQDEFIRICEWKTDRSKSRVKNNSVQLIEEATRIVFSTKVEPLRIGILTLLKGVSYPTASVFLHFLHEDTYPIIDFRALESIGLKKPPGYTFEFWWDYVKTCRNLADHFGVNMRVLDQALWQYSKDKAKKMIM